MESLSEHATDLLKAITITDQVQSLGLGTVRSDLQYYLVRPLSSMIFARFTNLQKLSVDYDHMNDHWLGTLEGLPSMRTLLLHVHGLRNDQLEMSNESWQKLTTKNPALRLHLVLVRKTRSDLSIN